MTLTEFLTARFDEDEADASDATPGPWLWTGTESGPNLRADGELPLMVGTVPFPIDGRHVARHDPYRVLAEVEAKRLILQQCVESSIYAGAEFMCRHIPMLLALPYADHPDYDEEWRP